VCVSLVRRSQSERRLGRREGEREGECGQSDDGKRGREEVTRGQSERETHTHKHTHTHTHTAKREREGIVAHTAERKTTVAAAVQTNT
jgi:hypothetical protein